MNAATKSVVIVGGGSAGWITAGRIAAKYRANPDIRVTLIESPQIPIIGVGEGTWPTMRNTLLQLGISETSFFRECDASFKQGAKFAQWVDGSDDDFYYHPLMLPQGFAKGDLAPFWQHRKHADKRSFSQSVCFQEALCEQNLAPKTIRTPEFSSVANYAYHLDAGKFSGFLQKHCCEKLGVEHRIAEVVHINTAANGDIASLRLSSGEDIEGDLFVDCTGFKSLLLGEHFQIPFKDCRDILFIDTALAFHVPYPQADSPIASHTISTAQQAGWIWDIGLPQRRGVGHVYASRYTSEEEAERTLRAYVGPQADALSVRKIPIRSGHREVFWHNNCVAVGLSAGFLEPLEASALVLVELSATMIAEQLPANRSVMNIVAKRFNETFLYRWDRIIDFLKLHYVLSKRSDSPFWTDNRHPSTIPDSLQELLTLWQYHSPSDRDFSSNNEVFPAASYQYVLYGMGFETDFSHAQHLFEQQDFADQQFNQNKNTIERALSSLPSNRELIQKIHAYGFQRL